MSRIRITGGEWRSRLLKVAAVQGLRPTPDSVRETLFNWLGQDLTGMQCLDLFAGTGALGFEAASRGAAKVTLVEQNIGAFAVLRQNARLLGAERLQLVHADAVKFISAGVRADRDKAVGGPQQPPTRYDVMFLDPPYGQGLLARIEPFLNERATSGSRLYVEAEYAVESLGSWRVVRHGQAGLAYYHLLERP